MKPRVSTAMIAWVSFSLLVGCEELVSAIEDDVAKKVVEGNEGTESDPGDEADSEIPTELATKTDITNIIPDRGFTTGGDLIEIIGFGFEPGMVIEFLPTPKACLHPDQPVMTEDACGNLLIPGEQSRCENDIWRTPDDKRVQADPLLVNIEEHRIVLRTPAYPLGQGPAMVLVRSPLGTPPSLFRLAHEPDGFFFYDPLAVFDFSPKQGPAEGGTEVTITGQGFLNPCQVVFGGEPVAGKTIDSQTVIATTPPMSPGLHPVTVTTQWNHATATDPQSGELVFFQAISPVLVDGITPQFGPTTGGTPLVVDGRGFVANTELYLGDQLLAAAASPDQRSLNATTLPRDPPQEGPVPVRANNAHGDDTLSDAFVFYNPNNTTPRIIYMSPQASDEAGGQEITLVLGGFADTTPAVAFGQKPASCQNFDAYVLKCITPPGTGVVDVVVDGEVLWPDGLRYLNLQLHDFSPKSGAIAGGTYVEVFGAGFSSPIQVLVAGQPAKRIELKSPTELVFWTPPGELGLAPVTVEKEGVAANATDSFTYFDPFIAEGWVAGDDIDGTLHVRVIDNRGNAVPDAYVIAGDTMVDGRDYLHGFTDKRGQITLSGPDFVGPHSVHAGKEGFGAFSFVGMNRNILTLELITGPPAQEDPLPMCPEQDGGGGGGTGGGVAPPSGPPLLSGTVLRSKDDPYNTGDDTVIVTTTRSIAGQWLPNPGPNSSLPWMGDYELISRTGDLMVIAMAGHWSSNDNFNVHSLGFRAFVYAEASSMRHCDPDIDTSACLPGEECVHWQRIKDREPDETCKSYCMRTYAGTDVTIDTPLDQPLRFDLINAPYQRPSEEPGAGPNVVRASVYYDFGYQGVHPMAEIYTGEVDSIVIDMPKAMPERLGVVPFSIDIDFGYQDGGRFTLPYSRYRLDGLTSTQEPIAVSPLVKTQRFNQLGAGEAEGPLLFDFEFRPSDLPDSVVHGNRHLIWDVVDIVPCQDANPISYQTIRWRILTSGQTTDFFLPVFPPAADGANIPPGEPRWQIDSYYSPGASLDFGQFNYQALLSWQGRAIASTPLPVLPTH